MTCIICELNPLHNGHKFIIDEAAKDGPVVLVMSGNFTQRGSAAVFDKYTRGEAAVRAGADLVLELPFPWCSAGAADFARAGVAVAKAIGADSLTFGSGSGDAGLLRCAGEAFADADFDSAFENAAKADPTEGAAILRQRMIGDMFTPHEAESLANPNDILGIEYFRYAHVLGGPDCVPVKRTEGGCVISATAIRRMIADGGITDAAKYIPDEVMPVFENAVHISETTLYDIERLLLRMDVCDMENAAEAEGGLGYRLRRIAGESGNGEDMLRLAATKKYTDARIRRALLYSVLGITREQVRGTPCYTTVLGIGKNGSAILRQIKRSGNIEVLTKAADHEKLSPAASVQFNLTAKADRLYTMLMAGKVHEEYFLSVTPYVEK